MMKKISLLSFLILFVATTFAQNFNTAKLDSFFNALVANNKYMGNVAIDKNGKTIYAKAVGKADIETDKDANTSSKYRIGSISKTFTATLIFKAIDEQKLSLDQTISKYFPTIKNADKITIGNLLNHRSGIFNFTEIPGENQWEQAFHTEEDFIGYFMNEKSNFEPGSDYAYSNTNYALLGFILQKIFLNFRSFHGRNSSVIKSGIDAIFFQLIRHFFRFFPR